MCVVAWQQVIVFSQPRMSCPSPILHCSGVFLARLESNTVSSAASFVGLCTPGVGGWGGGELHALSIASPALFTVLTRT